MGRKPVVEQANGADPNADEGFDEAPEFDFEGDDDEEGDEDASDFGC